MGSGHPVRFFPRSRRGRFQTDRTTLQTGNLDPPPTIVIQENTKPRLRVCKQA